MKVGDVDVLLDEADERALFDTEAEAARAYDEAALRAFGLFARLNFPPS